MSQLNVYEHISQRYEVISPDDHDGKRWRFVIGVEDGSLSHKFSDKEMLEHIKVCQEALKKYYNGNLDI